ncbi:MAG: hypothetical protein LBL52_01340 [Rickettsiales bacterium]|jgi:hypothetical protein|nr:hypothetical protein [Rickettsiales bacterium]
MKKIALFALATLAACSTNDGWSPGTPGSGKPGESKPGSKPADPFPSISGSTIPASSAVDLIAGTDLTIPTETIFATGGDSYTVGLVSKDMGTGKGTLSTVKFQYDSQTLGQNALIDKSFTSFALNPSGRIVSKIADAGKYTFKEPVVGGGTATIDVNVSKSLALVMMASLPTGTGNQLSPLKYTNFGYVRIGNEMKTNAESWATAEYKPYAIGYGTSIQDVTITAGGNMVFSGAAIAGITSSETGASHKTDEFKELVGTATLTLDNSVNSATTTNQSSLAIVLPGYYTFTYTNPASGTASLAISNPGTGYAGGSFALDQTAPTAGHSNRFGIYGTSTGSNPITYTPEEAAGIFGYTENNATTGRTITINGAFGAKKQQ